MSNPQFSVIIPTFNRKPFLKKAVDTVLAQTMVDFELIIIDDGSTDQTDQLIADYEDQRVKYIQQDNHGVAHARNRGLEKAKSEWIAFLDSDDWWLPNKLERFAQVISEHPNIKIFHSEEKWFRSSELLNPKDKHQKPTGKVYQSAIPLCCISISTAVVHRSVFEKVGVFDEELLACEDYDFWLRATHEFEVKLIPEFLTEKEGGRDDQLSSQWGLDRYRIRALEKMLTSSKLNENDYALTYNEFARKTAIFLKGALKRGRHKEAQNYQLLIEKYKP